MKMPRQLLWMLPHLPPKPLCGIRTKVYSPVCQCTEPGDPWLRVPMGRDILNSTGATWSGPNSCGNPFLIPGGPTHSYSPRTTWPGALGRQPGRETPSAASLAPSCRPRGEPGDARPGPALPPPPCRGPPCVPCTGRPVAPDHHS